MVGTDFEGTGKNKNLNEIKENEMILDIGFNTIKNIQKKINESKTVLGMDLPVFWKRQLFNRNYVDCWKYF